MAVFSLISGSSGKSSAIVPLIVEEYLPAEIVTLVSLDEISIVSPFGKLETNSARSLAGTVTTPFSELDTGKKSTMAISRLVVTRETFLLSTLISTLFKIGRVTLPIAMRLTLFKALLNFSCVTLIFIFISLSII